MSQTQTTLSASETLPQYAQTVIIGGGSIGCSIAWHLAKDGMTDVVLLEKNELTSGSTWHAAGNCPNFVGSWTVMKMQHYSTELYRKLGELTDYPMNYHVTGLSGWRTPVREWKSLNMCAPWVSRWAFQWR